jgi:antitoxin FitA
MRYQPVTDLLLRNVEPTVVARLKSRADQHGRSVEDEHRAILHHALQVDNRETPTMSFEAYLRNMPDVGTDADFARIEGSIRDIDLAG